MCRKKQDHICSSQGTGFVEHKADGTCCISIPSTKGLFFSDIKGNTAHVLINTVDKNKNKYTVKQYSDHQTARIIQDNIGKPSTIDLVKCLENNLIPN